MKNNTLKILISILALLFILSGCEVQQGNMRPSEASLSGVYAYGDTENLSVSAEYIAEIDERHQMYVTRNYRITNSGDEDKTCLFAFPQEYQRNDIRCVIDGQPAEGYAVEADNVNSGMVTAVDRERVDSAYDRYIPLLKPATVITAKPVVPYGQADDDVKAVMEDFRLSVTYNLDDGHLYYLQAPLETAENDDGTVSESFALTGGGYLVTDVKAVYDIGFFAYVGNDEKLSYSLTYEGEDLKSPEDYYSLDTAETTVGGILREVHTWEYGNDSYSPWETKNSDINRIIGLNETTKEPRRDLRKLLDGKYDSEVSVFFTEITVPAGETVTAESYVEMPYGAVMIYVDFDDESGIDLKEVTFTVSSGMEHLSGDNMGLDRRAETDTVTLDPGRDDYYIETKYYQAPDDE